MRYPNNNQDNVFDDDYIALLSIMSAVLQIYNLSQSEDQSKDNSYIMRTQDKILEKINHLEGKLNRLERLTERRLYDGR